MDLYLLLGLIALLIVWGVMIYNKLIALKNRASNGFAQIEVQAPLRPHPQSSGNGESHHGPRTGNAGGRHCRPQQCGGRAAAGGSESRGRGCAGGPCPAEGALTQALGSFRVTMEAYPDLKANQNMMQLTETLESTENKVAFARQAFIRSWPTTPTALVSRPCSLQTDPGTPRILRSSSSKTVR